MARGRGISLTAASNALAKAAAGSFSALRRLNIIVPKGATEMEALAFVQQKYAGQAEAGATSSDHFTTSLTNAGEVIGTSLLPTFNRLAAEFSNYITRLEESGRLQRDANEAVTLLGDAFHTLGGAIKVVDEATGGFAHTLEILIALELGSKILGWAGALRVLAGEWGLVGAAATKAGIAQAAAATEGGAAAGAEGAAGGAAGAGGIGGLFAGGLLGQVAGSRVRGFFASRAAASEIGSAGLEGEAAAGVSATGVGALAVAAVAATAGLATLARKLNDAAGGGKTGDSIISGVEGVLTGGLFGNHNAGILGEVLNRGSLFRQFLSPTPPPPVNTPQQNEAGLGISTQQLFGQTPSGANFGGLTPMQRYWKTWVEGFKLTQAALMATLTKGNADDLAVARQIVAKVKNQINEGVLSGPALTQALQAEASALSTIWAAEAAAAQKRAAEAAAAKQKIITQIQNAIDPIKLEVALSKAQSLGQSTIPELKNLLAAAYKGLAEAIAHNNKKLEKQAYDQITSLKGQIKTAETSSTSTFQISGKLALRLAKDQALNGNVTADLEKERKALLHYIATHKKNIAAETDAYNQLAAINSQLTSSVTSAYGDYKKASLKAETSGLGLTRAQREALEARLSQRGPGGTTPESGVGAAGYVIDPATGRPVKVGHQRHHGGSGRTPSAYGSGGMESPTFHFDIKVELDGKQLTTVVTKGQQSYRKSNPSSRRGPHAATPTA